MNLQKSEGSGVKTGTKGIVTNARTRHPKRSNNNDKTGTKGIVPGARMRHQMSS